MDATALGTEAARRLAESGRARINPGLTETELEEIQRFWGFEFADDHRGFLVAGLPVGPRWPDWRDGDSDVLRRMLAWPADGVLFDVRRNGYWHPSWGQRPADTTAAVEVARGHLSQTPCMVPVYSHRYLPAGPAHSGHPVLSMYQTDIIRYGEDLDDYIGREFTAADPVPYDRAVTVPFWKDLCA